MLQVATNPEGFFRELGREPGIGGPSVVVLLTGLPLALQHILYAVQAASNTAPAMVAAVSWFFSPFLVWLLIGGILQATTKVVGGTGSFRTTLKYVGYGFVPVVVHSTLTLLATLLVLGGVDPSPYPAFKQSVETQSLFRAVDSGLVQGAFFLWSGSLWVFAVAYARNISRRDALVAAGTPSALIAVLLAIG